MGSLYLIDAESKGHLVESFHSYWTNSACCPCPKTAGRKIIDGPPENCTYILEQTLKTLKYLLEQTLV